MKQEEVHIYNKDSILKSEVIQVIKTCIKIIKCIGYTWSLIKIIIKTSTRSLGYGKGKFFK